jgi:tetratricopeptide (TPR) repeat protein
LQQYEAKWKVIDSIEKLPDYPARTLFTTWNLSFEQIQRENMKAAWLLKFFAYLDNRDIWYDLLRCAGKDRENPGWFIDSVGDKFIFESVMQVLTKYCLVESSYETGSYSLHVCVHDWTLNDLNQEVEVTFYRLALDCLSYHVPASDWGNLSSEAYTRFTPHATRLAHGRFMIILDQQRFSQKEFAKVEPIAELLYRKGQFTATESIQRLLLTSKELALGPDHSSTLNTVNNLGSLYADQGKLGEAERMYQRALAGKEQALGPDHSSTLDTVNNLGNLYADQGKLGEAERMYQRALAGKEQALGPDHSSTLYTVNNLGNLYKNQGKLGEAERMYQRALAGKEQALGPDHSSTLDTVYNLGNLYADQGKLGEAERMYQRALAGYEQALGPDHSSTLDTVNNLGLLYKNQGNSRAGHS